MKRKTALITGASRGIGQAAARAFAKEGYDVILNCLNSTGQLRRLSEKLEGEFHIQTLCQFGDAGDIAFVRRMFEEIRAFCGGIDVLINNAGIYHIGAIPYMLSQKSGKIINISSDWGLYGASCEAAYSASKGGVNAFTKALAKELAPSNIQVNAVACGVIDTDMNAGLDPLERSQLAETIPAGYFAPPGDVADFLLQLAAAPAYLTGQVIAFDGGWI